MADCSPTSARLATPDLRWSDGIPQTDQDGGYFNELDDDSASDPGNNTLSDHERRQVGTWETLPINENVSKMAEMEVVPCPGADTRSGDEPDVAAPRTLPTQEVEAGDVASRKHAGKRGAFDLWAVGGVVLSSLSASADALLTDGSKTVRAKALACSLCILTAHGGGIKPACFDDGATEAGGAPRGSNTLKTILQAVRKVRHEPSVQSENTFKLVRAIVMNMQQYAFGWQALESTPVTR